MNLLVVPALAAALLSVVLPARSANGDTIYRCGSEYRQSDCAGGRIVDAADPVTAARTADAATTAAAERRLAEQMARDRRADEASIHPARAGSLGPVKAADAGSDKPKPKRKPKKRTGAPGDGEFVARAPKVKVAKN